MQLNIWIKKMNFIKKSILALSTLSLAACMSTQPPVITMESNEVYQFDDDASFALNVAQMTRKTAGLSDVALPEEAQFKANGALVGAEYAMSFLTGGLIDLAGSMGAQSEADRAFNWKPMLVFLGDLDNPNVDADAVKIVEAELTKTFDNIEDANYLGLMRASTDVRDDNFLISFEGPLCDQAKQAKINYSKVIKAGLYTDVKAEYDQSCGAVVYIESPGKVNYKGEVSSVITITFIGGYETLSDIVVGTSGFAVVPKVYGRWGSGVQYTVPAPYVIHNNTMHLFTKDNSSFKLK
ncbi:hypothetical protein NDQ71_16220 [Pseudoalteromonas sp. KG3]|uniref:hypothetical protein n=1 Tax=Pseudoalteromonas sp. KG3 TaxID=2951137 RepID=UPI0026592A2F|nr:hypothetical protein [Pseudoalteromonas sp. KG3]WKD23152.1 hypothetical protein NDQ71_16220 [Pseudoalteromonas sp. KG3]